MSKKCDEYPAIHVGRVVFTKSVVQAITAPKTARRSMPPKRGICR